MTGCDLWSDKDKNSDKDTIGIKWKSLQHISFSFSPPPLLFCHKDKDKYNFGVLSHSVLYLCHPHLPLFRDKQDKRCLFSCRSKSLWDASFYCIIIEGLTWKDNQLLLGIVKLSSLLNLLVDSKQDKRCLFSCSLQIQDVVRCFFLLHSYKAFILSRFWALQNWVEGA